MDREIDLTGATVIVAAPGDRLTFVLAHEVTPWDGEYVLEELKKIFPGVGVHIVSSCGSVIHEPKPL